MLRRKRHKHIWFPFGWLGGERWACILCGKQKRHIDGEVSQ